MKKNKLVLATKILAIIIICLIGFVGIYLPWEKPFEMNNLIKDYKLSKDLKGYREISFEVSSDEENKDTLTEENFVKSKTIIEKRLNALGIQDYNLSLDKSNGTIYLQIPEDDLTDRVVSNVSETGSIELKDSKDEKEVFLTNDNLKKVEYGYGRDNNGYVVSLKIEFNKEGTEILKNLSENDYKTLPEDEEKDEDSSEEKSEDKKDSETEESEKEEQKEVTLYLSGNATTTTSFDEVITDGTLGLTVGRALQDQNAVNDAFNSAKTISILLNNGPLPIEYEVKQNQYVSTDINANSVKTVVIVFAIIVAILLIYMVTKYKQRGLLSIISFLGFVAILLLAMRVFNVTIALTGIVGIMLVILLNYVVSLKLLSVDNSDNKAYYKQYTDIVMKLIPLFVISMIFVYMPITLLSSIGMVMFWGIVIILAYNPAITKHIVD